MAEATEIERYIAWYEQMVATYSKLRQEEKEALKEWYEAHREQAGLADWPGWEKRLGKPPWHGR